MSNSVWPHRWQPTRFPHLWDSPGKNTGVGCHFLLQCMKVKSESEVTQSCQTLCDPMDCSPPGSSIHGIFQARILEWGAITFSRGVPLDKHKKKKMFAYIFLIQIVWLQYGSCWCELLNMTLSLALGFRYSLSHPVTSECSHMLYCDWAILSMLQLLKKKKITEQRRPWR